jgi:hypothetical protein
MVQEKGIGFVPLPIAVLGFCVEEQHLVSSVSACISFWAESV